MPEPKLDQLLALLATAIWFAYAGFEATHFPFLARIFPLSVALVAVILCVIEARNILTCSAEPASEVEARPRAVIVGSFRQTAPYLFYILGYLLAIFLVGFVIASAGFVFLFQVFLGRMSMLHAAVVVISVVGGLVILDRLLELNWPIGILGLTLPL